MKARINKPRVFLSHSKKDTTFIERLCDDLRKCQIDPWLDVYEIRHGQPWLDAIFEDGLPTCDAVIAYLTEHSIVSPVVRKEIDAGIIQKLRDNQIAFLPYVANSDIRLRLRSDLQTLQAPEWNEVNYHELLPRVVSEVWHSFLERVVAQVSQRERIGRLEAELRVQELQKLQEADVFPAPEARDFEYIWEKVDRFEPVVFVQIKGNNEPAQEVGRYTFGVHVGSLLPRLSGSSNYVYDRHDIYHLVLNAISPTLPGKNALPDDERVELSAWPDIGDELLMYGFVSRFHKNTQPTSNTVTKMLFVGHQPYGLMYTEKLERFKYWLARKGKLPNKVLWRTEPATSPNSESAARSPQG